LNLPEVGVEPFRVDGGLALRLASEEIRRSVAHDHVEAVAAPGRQNRELDEVAGKLRCLSRRVEAPRLLAHTRRLPLQRL